MHARSGSPPDDNHLTSLANVKSYVTLGPIH